MNKKVLIIGGGIVTFIISAIAGLYVYTKKSIKEIATARDDTFDIGEDNVQNIQCEYEMQQEEINGQKVTIESVYPKEEEKRTIKMPKISYCCYDAVGVNHAMQNDIDKLKKNVDELWAKYDELFNYQSYINTINLFDGDDGK